MYLRTKTQLVHFNNPSFVRDLYGPGLVCFANYTSSQDCDKAIGAMRDWFAKQDWTKRITLHVKKWDRLIRRREEEEEEERLNSNLTNQAVGSDIPTSFVNMRSWRRLFGRLNLYV